MGCTCSPSFYRKGETMRLSDYMLDLGRVVAFHPGLKKITHSTTATLLLSQFLYWTPKSKDGWIYKDSIEIEEETGLTYDEQKTARDKLILLGLLEEENKKLDHTIRFRVNQENLNTLWEKETGVTSQVYTKEEVNPPGEESVEDYFARKTSEKPPQKVYDHSIPKKKGDLVDAVISAPVMSGMKKSDRMIQIRDILEHKYHVHARNKKWEDFIAFILDREQMGEKLDIFIEWSIKKGFDPIYWTPDKMTTLWPGAFADSERMGYREDFVQPPPEIVQEEEYAPMPESLRRRNVNLE
jgi:hypothetical protein